MSDWIRPEDVHHYEELGEKAENTNLVLKLTDRARKTDWLVNVVKAYAEKSYDGNLMDILNYVGNKGGYQQIKKAPMIKGALTGKIGWGLLKLKAATLLPEVYIDNKGLNGFLDHFLNKPCEDMTCYTGDKTYGECRFCYNLGERVVRIDEDKRKEAIGNVEEVISKIESGEIF